MKCPKCKREISDQNDWCNYCGAHLSAIRESQPDAEQADSQMKLSPEEKRRKRQYQRSRRQRKPQQDRGIAEVNPILDFKLKNPRAVAWMQAHGAEGVEGIDEATRAELRQILSAAIEEGRSYTNVASQIASRFEEFAAEVTEFKSINVKTRADLIAQTELKTAYGEGNRMALEEIMAEGVDMEHHWWTSGSDRVCEVCHTNEVAGWIPADQAFPSGHYASPAHPACECYIASRVKGMD